MNNDEEKKEKQTLDKKNDIIKKWSYLVASGFGIGFIPFMPGTAASFAALPLAWFLLKVGQTNGLIVGTLIIFTVSYFVVKIALKYSKDNHDPSFIVVDEVTGQLFTFILPALFWKGEWRIEAYIAGFILFRFFDILKPFHVGWVQKNVKGSLGVILDDIIAALYATVLLFIIMLIAKPLA